MINEDATNYNVIASTFIVDGDNYGPLSSCIGSAKMDHLKHESACFSAVLANWKYGISGTAVSTVTGSDVLGIECLPFDELRAVRHRGQSIDLLTARPEVVEVLLKQYQNINYNGNVIISRKDFVLLLKREVNISNGLAINIYKILQKYSLSSCDQMKSEMEKFEQDFQWMECIKDPYYNTFSTETRYGCTLQPDGNRLQNRDTISNELNTDIVCGDVPGIYEENNATF